jgi:Tfp pilus assembly protein PilZ
MSQSERRKNPRFKVGVPVQLSYEAAVYEAALKDICRDAVLVDSPRAFPVGSLVSLVVQLPGTGGPLQAAGQVVRVAQTHNGAADVALLFSGMTPAAETRIEFFIAMQGD